MRSMIIAAAIALAAAAAAAEEKPVQLKQAPGLDKVEANCGACHSLDYVPMNSPFLNAAGWDAEVAKMINAFGAPIDPADAKIISDYLKNNYSVVPERLNLHSDLSLTGSQTGRTIAPKTPNQPSNLGRTSDRIRPSNTVTHHQSGQVTGKKPTVGASARMGTPGMAKTKPPWAGPYETCWTDDGGFRFRSCSALGLGDGGGGGGGGGGGE